jgi:hypothetical protein
MRGIGWRIGGAAIAITLAAGTGAAAGAIVGAAAIGWLAASGAGAVCADALSRRRRRSPGWVSEMVGRAGATTAPGDGTLRGEPVLVVAMRGWKDPCSDIYDCGGRLIATGQPRPEGPSVLTGRLGEYIAERARDVTDFRDPTGEHLVSLVRKREPGKVLPRLIVTGPDGAELGELPLANTDTTLRSGDEIVGRLRQQSTWWRWSLALELGRFTIEDSTGAVVGEVTRTDRGRGGSRACNMIVYKPQAPPPLRQLAPAINEGINSALDLSTWTRVFVRSAEKLVAASDALDR